MALTSKLGRISLTALAALALSAFWTHGAWAQDSSGAPDSLVEKYGDWTVECGGGAEGTKPLCRMAQQLQRKGSQKPVLSIFLRAKQEKAEALITLIGPLGISLAEGIAVSVADNRLVEADFLTCRPIGCIAQKELGAEAIQAFRAGDQAIVKMAPLNGDAIAITVSLNGFSAAWARLKAL